MRRIPHALALVVVGLVCFPPTACTVRSDEFLCEDAVAKLQGCCAEQSLAKVSCTYDDSTCLETTYPALGERTSRCVLSASCDDLRHGACVALGCR